MATKTDLIRDFYNRIIGKIETDDRTGKKIAKDFYNRIIGRYDPETNTTKDFYNRVVARGDALTGLIFAENEKQEAKRKATTLNRK